MADIQIPITASDLEKLKALAQTDCIPLNMLALTYGVCNYDIEIVQHIAELSRIAAHRSQSDDKREVYAEAFQICVDEVGSR